MLDSREYICTEFFTKKVRSVKDYVKPAISLLEFSSIAAGVSATDEMIKKAEISGFNCWRGGTRRGIFQERQGYVRRLAR